MLKPVENTDGYIRTIIIVVELVLKAVHTIIHYVTDWIKDELQP